MSPRVEEQELRRRAIEGLRDEVEAFGSGATDLKLIRHEGLVASVTPAGVESGPIGAASCAILNDLVYGYDEDGFRAGLAGETPIRWYRPLAGARERGLSSASLQATRAGAPLYERLGFRDFGFVEMWELRR